MEYKLSKIAQITSGRLIGKDIKCFDISHDSRTISSSEGIIFVALPGDRYDGHSYIESSYNRLVRAFIVSLEFDEYSKYPDASFVVVSSPLKALQELAAHHRTIYKGALLAITGSSGKTIIKELISQIFGYESGLFRSPKSYNSQIGVALSLLMIKGDEKLVVIEAGISQKGEMAALENMIKPTMVLITNIGDAHSENFISKREKLLEKLILCRDANTIVYNIESKAALIIEEIYPRQMLSGWSYNSHDIKLPFDDTIYRENIHHAIAALTALDMSPDDLQERVMKVERLNMRLAIRAGLNNSEIINDSYNSDFGSLQVAINYMQSIARGRPRIIVISDILQSGEKSDALYSRVAKLISDTHIDLFIAIGMEIGSCRELFKDNNALFFSSTLEFISNIDTSLFKGSITLLKGCREFKFEKIQSILEQKLHNTILEVNLDNILHNLAYHRALTAKKVKIMAMVKAQSYGAGNFEVARELEKAHVDYLAVAYADEGVELRQKGITTRIVVLGSDSFSFHTMIEHHLEPEIYSLQALDEFAKQCAISAQYRYPIHIKIDSGMHRLGFCEGEVDELIDRVKRYTQISIATIFSHLAGSDDPTHREFTERQIDIFDKISSRITSEFPYKILRHICNSAAIPNYPNAHFDMVRLGIGMYGFGSFGDSSLKVVSTLKSIITQIRDVKKGDSIGYNRAETASRDSKIAIISIGYADGFRRALSLGRWSVKIGNHQAPTIGNICMDTSMIDITGIDVKVGDFVTIFGEEPSVSEMAKRLSTIEYEVLTDISMRVKRTYIKE